MASTHNAGAAALVKHRGAANCKSPLAIGLLFAVRTQLVEHAIEEGLAFKRCPDRLSAIFKSLPQNASARLTSATINIADLRYCAKTALCAPRSPEADKEVNDLLEYAISIDLLVAAWPQSLPDDWAWQPADSFDLPAHHQRDAFIYHDRSDTYLDLWVLSIWNQYRAARIKIQTIILDCVAYMGPAYDEQWYWRALYASMIAQEMADEICASVPFALGTKMFGGPGDREGIEYPYVVGGQKASQEHRRAATALGGWHLLDPLKSCLHTRSGVLREGQLEWVQGQMERIGRIYALGRQKGTGEPTARAAEQSMFDRFSYEFPL